MEISTRPGIAGTAYDTAWLAGIAAGVSPTKRRASRFPTALEWLVRNQLPDGSWGGELRYEHDRILSTLAALGALARFGTRPADKAAVAAGTRYLWQNGHRLKTEPMELVAFELLLPALADRAQRAGVTVPSEIDIYARQREEKLRLIPPAALYGRTTTAVHSLEFLGESADVDGLRRAQGANGSVGNSPAATAFFFERTRDPRALTYLEESAARVGGAMAPVLYPCETFELLWSAYHLLLAGVPAGQLLSATQRASLRTQLGNGGVSLSPTFPLPDADDTAVALVLLHAAGDAARPEVLQGFATSGGSFASFAHERHSSVGVNLHVLHALAAVPGYPDAAATIERLLDYVEAQQVRGLYWIDKWHVSPYYATSHALCVLRRLPPTPRLRRLTPAVNGALEWLRQTQNEDGSWGFYGRPTAEETAFGLLALAACGPPGESSVSPADRRRCAAAARYLREQDATPPVPLWIDKCLYVPTLVVRSVVEAALIAERRLRRASSATAWRAPRHWRAN